MRSSKVAAAILITTLALTGCDRGPDRSTVIADPPEAFYPHEFVALGEARTWGDIRFYVPGVSVSVGSDVADIDLTVEVIYTNLSSHDKNPPTEVRFEFGGRSYAAAARTELKPPHSGFGDEPIPANGSAQGLITGTLTDVADADPPSPDEMHHIVTRTRLVIGAPGTSAAVFEFTE